MKSNPENLSAIHYRGTMRLSRDAWYTIIFFVGGDQ